MLFYDFYDIIYAFLIFMISFMIFYDFLTTRKLGYLRVIAPQVSGLLAWSCLGLVVLSCLGSQVAILSEQELSRQESPSNSAAPGFSNWPRRRHGQQ